MKIDGYQLIIRGSKEREREKKNGSRVDFATSFTFLRLWTFFLEILFPFF